MPTRHSLAGLLLACAVACGGGDAPPRADAAGEWVCENRLAPPG